MATKKHKDAIPKVRNQNQRVLKLETLVQSQNKSCLKAEKSIPQICSTDTTSFHPTKFGMYECRTSDFVGPIQERVELRMR
jgi:hypothetical protein